MKITEIRTSNAGNAQLLDAKAFKPELAEKKAANVSKDKVDISTSNNNWQKDILLSALDMLEASIKPDESMPLDRIENRPIENFDEALIELQFLKSDKFANEAVAAQANINAIDILHLFMEEAA